MKLPLKQLLSVLKGLSNGVQYGFKVRFVHTFVISLLFKSVSKKQLINILRASIQHGRNLGLFVFAYKTLCYLLEKVWGNRHINTFISGFIFGAIIFGKKSPVNYQIVLYIFSRVILALVALIYRRYFRNRWNQVKPPLQRKYGYMIFAGLCWGLVMWLFSIDRSMLQASLASSMNFLYIESNEPIKSWKQLIPYMNQK